MHEYCHSNLGAIHAKVYGFHEQQQLQQRISERPQTFTGTGMFTIWYSTLHLICLYMYGV